MTPLATTLMALGCKEAMVVHGIGGIDEVSLFGKTVVARVNGSTLTHHELSPSDFSLKPVKPSQLLVTDPDESALLTVRLLNESPHVQEPKTSFALANAAAAILISGLEDDLPYCVDLATESIASGAAYGKLKELVELSGGNLSVLDELEGSHA